MRFPLLTEIEPHDDRKLVNDGSPPTSDVGAGGARGGQAGEEVGSGNGKAVRPSAKSDL